MHAAGRVRSGYAARRAALSLAILPALLIVTAAAGDAPAAAGEGAGAELLRVEKGPGGEIYRIVCAGAPRSRLVEEMDGTLFTVALPGAVNRIDPGELPEPSGAVRAISVGSDDEGARLTFTLHRRAVGSLREEDGALVLHLIPAAAAEAHGEMRPLGTEDLIEISVFEVPDLNRTVRVGESGTVSLPLVGEVVAAGLTPRELEVKIEGLLAGGYVKDPHVSVFVQEHGSKQVSVLGAVGKPGVYQMLGPRTLLQVIAQAGGLTPERGAEIFVIRASPGGGYEKIPVDVAALMSSSDPSLNIAIQPGDVVSVPPDRLLHIYVDGAVRTPGRIEQPSSRRITLMQAIAKAGGATERANLKKVQILRKGASGSQTSIPVNLHDVRAGEATDPILEDGDVVVVPETFF